MVTSMLIVNYDADGGGDGDCDGSYAFLCRFKSSTSPEPIQAKLEYHVDLVCPNYEKQDSTPMETYIIYQVAFI